MAIQGNPLDLAREIGDGFHTLTPAVLKKYGPADLKVINNSLQRILRDVRGETSTPGDAEAIRKKSLRLQRLNQAILLISNHCREQRIPL
jgi:hypothetical protein